MNPKDIREWVDFLTGAFVTWGIAAKHPISAVDILLAKEGKKKLITHAIEIWFSGFVLSLVIQLPVYKIIGIEWADPAFFVPYTAVLLSMFLITTLAIDFSLKRVGIESEFPRTFLAYSCVLAGPAPLITLLTFHGMTDLLSPLEMAKHDGLSFLNSIFVAFPAISKTVNDNATLAVANSVTLFMSLAIFGLLQQSLLRIYETSRWDITRALAFAMGVLLPIPLIVGCLFLYFVLFAFL